MRRLLIVSSALVALAAGGPITAGGGGSIDVSGEVYYLPRIALPPTAVLHISVEDVSRMDVPAVVLAESYVEPAGQVPIAFELRVDAARVGAGRRYAIRARIEAGGRLLWVNTENIPLRLDGSDHVRVRVDQVGG